jgi:hypothetical protein
LKNPGAEYLKLDGWFCPKSFSEHSVSTKNKMANIYQKLEEKFIFASDSKSHPQIGIITVKNARSKFSCLGTFYHGKQ